MSETVAVFGAGGKMGCRITDNLKSSEYRMLYVEVSPAGIERLGQRGVAATPQEDAVRQADIAVLALPDAVIGKVAPTIVPEIGRAHV